MKGKMKRNDGRKYEIDIPISTPIIKYEYIRGGKEFHILPKGDILNIEVRKSGNKLLINEIDAGQSFVYWFDNLEFFRFPNADNNNDILILEFIFKNSELILVYDTTKPGVEQIYQQHIQLFKEYTEL